MNLGVFQESFEWVNDLECFPELKSQVALPELAKPDYVGTADTVVEFPFEIKTPRRSTLTSIFLQSCVKKKKLQLVKLSYDYEASECVKPDYA